MFYAIFITGLGLITIVFIFLFRSKKNTDSYSRIHLKEQLNVNGIISFFEKHEVVLKNGLPPVVKLFNCFTQDYYFNPPKVMRTKKLTICTSTNLKVNWEKFTNLQTLFILADNINLEDLIVCRNLSNIKIRLSKPMELPLFFNDLPNLKLLRTNLQPHLNSSSNHKIEFIDNYSLL